MNQSLTISTITTFVIAGVIGFLAWSGVRTSIADAIVILGCSFSLTHLFFLSYCLGRKHAYRELAEASKSAKPVTGPAKANTKTDSKTLPIFEKKQGWNPMEDF